MTQQSGSSFGRGGGPLRPRGGNQGLGTGTGRGTGQGQSLPGNRGNIMRAPDDFDEGWKGVRCFICDLTVPKHDLGTCAIAMKKTNKQRASMARKRQVCFACLRRDCLVERFKNNLTESVCNNVKLWVYCDECKKEASTPDFCFSALILSLIHI